MSTEQTDDGIGPDPILFAFMGGLGFGVAIGTMVFRPHWLPVALFVAMGALGVAGVRDGVQPQDADAERLEGETHG